MTPSSMMFASSALTADERLERLQQRLLEIRRLEAGRARRRHFRTCFLLFFATLLSTFVVGAGYLPLHYLIASVSPRYETFLRLSFLPRTLEAVMSEATRNGLWYSLPLMLILLSHEMGHFLQSRWNRVPASLPYFIPMPLTPLGTMGAVILQGRGVATRRQMFDIAVWGPIAGMIVTLPVLWFGLKMSQYSDRPTGPLLEFGDPLLLQWMSTAVLGPMPAGQILTVHPLAFAGWVGILVTSLNLIPVGQLDGGHILYTLIGRRAHLIAMLLLAAGMGWMVFRQDYSFSLLIFLLLITGPRHPPTANDIEPLGWWRHIVGWLTLSFLIIGFTPQPISVNGEPETDTENPPAQQAPPSDELI